MESPSQRRSPYQGLIPYEADDALFFFGREKETRLIAANLFAAPLTLLYGASGVGKSSVLRAGVINHLRARDDVLVVAFHTWQSDPLVDLQAAIATAVTRANGQSISPADSTSLAEYLAACTARLERRLMVILDQFEEYFLYHPHDDAFAEEFPTAVMQAEAPVSFLIAIREDSLAKLDRFEGRIPILFDNYLRIEHLDSKAARAAIENPIEQYNRLHAENGEQVSIEPMLVETVLEQVAAGQVILGEAGRGVIKIEATEAQVETPYLQLVMTRLWDEEMRAGSHILRLETLDRLGGAERIVRTHLDAVMSALLPNEQDIAASVFHYLVTPSGTKIAHTIPDLIEYAGLPQMHLTPVLEKLSGRGDRILRPVAPPPDQPNMPRYEIFHDVLAPAILDWRARHVQEQERAEAEKRETARQRELEQAKTLAEEQQRRAEEQARVAGRLRRLLAALVIASLLAVGAVVLAWTNWHLAATRAAEAEKARAKAGAAQEEALAERDRAEQQAQRSFSREVAAAAISNLDMDPERSVLLALYAASLSYSINQPVTPETENALHRAVQTSRVRLTLSGHTNGINGVAFSPDGTRLATASDDKTAKVWEAASGHELLTLSGHTNWVWGVAFSPDGTRLATASDDKTVRVYVVNMERLMALARTRVTRSLTAEECKKYLHSEEGCPLPATALNHIMEGNNLARAGDVDNAVASFRKALELDPALRFAPETEAGRLAAEFLVEKGQSLAKAGDADGAITSFQKALDLDPTLRLAPEAETRRLAAEGLVERSQRLAKAGDVDSAIASFQKALAYNPSLVFDLQVKAGKLLTEVLVEEGGQLVRQGKVREAIGAYAGAAKLDPALKISAERWNSLCWFGSLWKHADEVMFACEKAVALQPEDWNFRDSRGVARALTGNTKGAIEDFQSLIKGTDNHKWKLQRQRWIGALRSGKNPFTDKEIKILFD